METILVATDLSDRSDRAIARALQLASASAATCHVVSVMGDALTMDHSAKLEQDIKEQLSRGLRGYPTPPLTEVTVLRGEVSEMLVRYAILHDVDLVVLGLHRAHVVLDSLRETTMTRIVAASPAPVLLACDPVEQPYAKALVPVSFSSSCAAAIRAVQSLLPQADMATFHALNIPFQGLTGGENSAMARSVMAEAETLRSTWMATEDIKGDAAPEILPGAVRMLLDRLLQREQADLLAIGAHMRSGPSIQKLGGFATELVRDPPVDLLISPPRADRS